MNINRQMELEIDMKKLLDGDNNTSIKLCEEEKR